MSKHVARMAAVVETSFWATRLTFHVAPTLLALASASAANDPPSAGRLALFGLFVMLVHGGIIVVNDLLDEADDRVTAPYLPLPSGLMTRRHAVLTALVVEALALLFLWVVVDGHAVRFFGVLIALLGAVALTAAYSLVKRFGFAGPVFAGIPYASAVAGGWIVGQGGSGGVLAALLLYALVTGITNNLLAALRDVDADSDVGTGTPAVRWGAVSAFVVAEWLTAFSLVIVGVLVVSERAVPAALLAVSAAVFSWVGAKRASPTLRASGRGRVTRVHDLRTFRLGTFVRNVAVVATFDVVLAVVFGVVLEGIFLAGMIAYKRRVVDGELLEAARQRAQA